jgi:hypothetical protein
MAVSLTDLVFANTRADDPLNANAPPTADPNKQGSARVSAFLTKQSAFHFAALTATVKLLWEAAESLGHWAHSTWIPLAIAGIIGLVELVVSLGHSDSKLRWSDYPLALSIAFANTSVLWFAALGTHEVTRP